MHGLLPGSREPNRRQRLTVRVCRVFLQRTAHSEQLPVRQRRVCGAQEGGEALGDGEGHLGE